MRAKVVGINISEKKGIAKQPIDIGILIEDHGLKSDAHAGKWHRQVSLLAIESIQKMKAENTGLCAGSFAENITTEGIELYSLKVGTRLKIGETLHEVTQIGKECHEGCEIKKTVGKCIVPKEGIFTKVIVGGKVQKGDLIKIL
ncbi:MOSC domain-containing protein [bacterium]